jgi:glycosyltransferase involved in cell wall biosynthesis
MGAELTLVTFEKPHDLADESAMAQVRAVLNESGIVWIPLAYHKDPKIPATLFDITHAVIRGFAANLSGRFDIIHARTFIGGLVGLMLAPLIRAKLIYHNEGFYPDEQVDSGVWANGSRPHVVANRLESLIRKRADGITALSFRAKKILEESEEIASRATPVIFVPSCVDLDRFRPDSGNYLRKDDEIRLVYSGSVGGRYILDRVGSFMNFAINAGHKMTLKIFSKSDPKLIEDLLDRGGLPRSAWSLETAKYSDMPGLLAGFDAGIHFLQKGISEHTGSPTKIGEYWAVGLPVVITPNMGDNDVVAKDEKVGVVLESHDDEGYRKLTSDLIGLLEDPDVRARCRRAAEEHYALQPACERQFELYQHLCK